MSQCDSTDATINPQLPPSLQSGYGTASLLECSEVLDAYLADVRRRLDAHRLERTRAYWRSAIERIGAEIQAAEQADAFEIVAELQAVTSAFHEALAAHSPEDTETESSSTLDGSISQIPPHPDVLGLPPIPVALPAKADFQSPQYRNGTNAALKPSQETATSALTPEATEAEREVQHRRDEKTRQELADKAQNLGDRIVQFLTDHENRLAETLRARALYCEGTMLIHHPLAPKQGGQSLLNLLDDLEDRTLWSDTTPFRGSLFGPQAWSQLGELYSGCAIAADAMDWYEDNEEHIAESSRVEMLNAIAAAQQLLYRRPESAIRRDAAVQELYQRLREAGQRTAYIRALGPHIADDELPELAGRCTEILHSLRKEVQEKREQAERQARREATVGAVIAWEESLEGRGITSDTLESDRQRLCTLLDECLAAGVPTTNVKVRTAILDTAPVLLAGQPRYAKFLDAVLAERARREMAAVEVMPSHPQLRDENLDVMVKQIVGFTHGKVMVMLGGKSRPPVAQEIGALLECSVSWLDSDNGDKFTKFASAVKKADMILMLKNFASHELFYKSKDAMAADGKHFVVLPCGYGVKQVVYQLAEYVGRERAVNGAV